MYRAKVVLLIKDLVVLSLVCMLHVQDKKLVNRYLPEWLLWNNTLPHMYTLIAALFFYWCVWNHIIAATLEHAKTQ